MSQIEQIIQAHRELLWGFAIVFLRVGAVVSLFPGIGEHSVPVRVKLALALTITAAISPLIVPSMSGTPIGPQLFSTVVISEIAIGLMFGIGTRLFLIVLQTCGSMAAQATSLAQILGSQGSVPLPTIGHLLAIGGVAVAMLFGLHVHVIEMLVKTYSLFPVGYFPDASAVTQWGVQQIASAFALAFTLAAPFLLVSLLYNLTLGVINRAMPQLMVVFVGAPAITGMALALLFLLTPTLLTIWVRAFQDFIINPLEVF